MTSSTVQNNMTSDMSETGVIFNIQRFSLHDGPGMRTVLFFKGCPLNCLWCSNPESQNPDAELMYYRNKCIRCGNCVKAAEKDSSVDQRSAAGIVMKSDGPELDRPVLTAGGRLPDIISACPTGALEIIGRKTSAEEIIPVLMRDASYFRRSGGGITLSGGEPSMQAGFCREVLERLRELGVHTAVETCGYRSWERFYNAVEYASLLLFDLKTVDSDIHKKAVGTDNDLILDNFIKIVPHKNIIVRIPVIPGFNTTDESFKQSAAFILNSGFRGEVHLLPYHSYGSGKYSALQWEYKLTDTEPPSEEQLDRWAYGMEAEGLKVKIHKH